MIKVKPVGCAPNFSIFYLQSIVSVTNEYFSFQKLFVFCTFGRDFIKIIILINSDVSTDVYLGHLKSVLRRPKTLMTLRWTPRKRQAKP